MKRRSFVKSTLLTGAAASIIPAVSLAANNNIPPAMETDYYELRTYTLKNEAQQKLVEDYLKDAAIPALNRAGVNNVGVFTELKPEGQTKVYVLSTYKSMAAIDQVSEKLGKDKGFMEKAAPYYNAPATAPAYERIESSLMKAFKHSPILETHEKKTRIFELRQYQSASEAAGKKKIQMFNDEGEIDIFKRLGFKPVFWGETIIGPLRPNLTYMVTFDDMDAKAAHWKAFVDDAQWKKISTVPDYADALLVNKITSTMLVPTAYSQI